MAAPVPEAVSVAPSPPPEPTVTATSIICKVKRTERVVPMLRMPPVDIQAAGCWELLEEVLKEPTLATTTKGDILEHIVKWVARSYYTVDDRAVKVEGAHATNGIGDGGKDVVVKRENERGGDIVVDCKAYEQGNPVKAKDVRSIMGALFCHKGARLGIVVTTSRFTRAAEKAKETFNSLNKPLHSMEIELWDGDLLCDKVNQAAEGNPAEWISKVLKDLQSEDLLILRNDEA